MTAMPDGNNEPFRIDKITHEDGAITAILVINQGSEIFKGHFPGQPVVPGACMLQILKEVLENALSLSLRLKKADHLKFISMVNPANTQTVQLDITYKHANESDINISAKLTSAATVCFKFQGVFNAS
jgi:3-hydroxyacyl-[acyl-carrier-protein] dehydratase